MGDKAEDQSIKRYERLYRRVRAQSRLALSLAATALLVGSGAVGIAVYSGAHSTGGVAMVYKAGATSMLSSPSPSPTPTPVVSSPTPTPSTATTTTAPLLTTTTTATSSAPAPAATPAPTPTPNPCTKANTGTVILSASGSGTLYQSPTVQAPTCIVVVRVAWNCVGHAMNGSYVWWSDPGGGETTLGPSTSTGGGGDEVLTAPGPISLAIHFADADCTWKVVAIS